MFHPEFGGDGHVADVEKLFSPMCKTIENQLNVFNKFYQDSMKIFEESLPPTIKQNMYDIGNIFDPLQSLQIMQGYEEACKKFLHMGNSIFKECYLPNIQQAEEKLKDSSIDDVLTNNSLKGLNIIKKNSEFIDHYTRETPKMDYNVPVETVWENKHLNLLLAHKPDGKTPTNNPVVIYNPQAGHGDKLAFFNSKEKPCKQQSIAHAALLSGLGPVLVTSWKAPHKEIMQDGLEDYIQTQHQISQFVKKHYEKPPHAIPLCQQGYMVLMNASKNPDDYNTIVRAGSPFDMHAGPYKDIRKVAAETPMENFEKMVEKNGGVMPGKNMVMLFNFKDLYGRTIGSNINMYNKVLDPDEDFDPERQLTMKSWFERDLLDIVGTYYLDLVRLFKYNSHITGDFDFSNYIGPLGEVTGGRDWITPWQQSVASFDYIGTPKDKIMHWHRENAGHIGVFTKEPMITGSDGQVSWMNDIFPWIIENSRY
ncbi:MAG: DUF3141 domain-containing protein [Nanoarchaeota archaeon]